MSATPRIAGFYGFKGGAGRSFLLASIAAALAVKGKRVLVIDADLEAPGIGDFFDGLASDGGDWRDKTGLLDLLAGIPREPETEEVRAKFREDLFHSAEADRPRTRFFSHFRPSGDVPPDSGIWLMGPGSHAADRLAGPQRYIRELTDFDWSEFLFARKGGAMLGLLMEELTGKGRFNQVLIDARTGYNFASLVLLRSLATDIVAVSTPAIQSLDGMARVLPILDIGSRAELRKHLVISKQPTPAEGEGKEALRDSLLEGWFEEQQPYRLPFVESFSREEGHLFLRFPQDYESFINALGDLESNRPKDNPPEVCFLHEFRKIHKAVTGEVLTNDNLIKSFRAWNSLIRLEFGASQGEPVKLDDLKTSLEAWIKGSSKTPLPGEAAEQSPVDAIRRRTLLEREHLRWCAAQLIDEALEQADKAERQGLWRHAKDLTLETLPVLSPRLAELLNPPTPAEDLEPCSAESAPDEGVPAAVYRMLRIAIDAWRGALAQDATDEWKRLDGEMTHSLSPWAERFLAAARALQEMTDRIAKGAGSDRSLSAALRLADAVEALGAPARSAELIRWNGCDLLDSLAEAVLVNAIAAPPELSDKEREIRARLSEIADAFQERLLDAAVQPPETGAVPAEVRQWLFYVSTLIAVRNGLLLLEDPEAPPPRGPLHERLAGLCRAWRRDFEARRQAGTEAWDGFASAVAVAMRLDRDAIARGEKTDEESGGLHGLGDSLGEIAEQLFEARGDSRDRMWINPLYRLLDASASLNKEPLTSRIARHLLAVLKPYGADIDLVPASSWMRHATISLGAGFSPAGTVIEPSKPAAAWAAYTADVFAGRFGAARAAFEKRLAPHDGRFPALRASEWSMLNWYAGMLAVLGDLSKAEARIDDLFRHRALGAAPGSAGFPSAFAVAEALRCAAALGGEGVEAAEGLGRRIDAGIKAAPGLAAEDRYFLIARLARRLGEVRAGVCRAEEALDEAKEIVDDYDALMQRRARSYADADYAEAAGYRWASLGMFTGRDVPAYKRRDHALLHLALAEMAHRARDQPLLRQSLDRAARFIGARAPDGQSPGFDNGFLGPLALALHEPRALWAAFCARDLARDEEHRAAFAALAQEERSADLAPEEGSRAGRRIYFDHVWELCGLSAPG